jgi:hypothetical protein
MQKEKDWTELINEEHVRLFYRLLNHKYLTELRFLKRGYFPTYRIVRNKDDFVVQCKKWNGKRNIYAGIRDRKKDLRTCANMFDIIGMQTIALDIDPVRVAEIPSTDEELKNSRTMARIIVDWFKSQSYQKPYLAMTGNGFCIYFSVPFYEITKDNRQEIADKLDSFEKGMRKFFKEDLKKYNCSIDSMYDLPRIGKAIGTLSIKGEHIKERPWRMSKWIEEPLQIREDKKLLHDILNDNFTSCR